MMIEIYGKTFCPYCDKAKALLIKKGVQAHINEIDISNNNELKQEMLEASGGRMTEVPISLDYDSKVQRLKRRYQGLSRVAAAINDLYIYGVYPSNFPNLTVVLEQAKDHCKEIIKETKAEIAFIENPNGMYDLVMDEVLDDADRETARKANETKD